MVPASTCQVGGRRVKKKKNCTRQHFYSQRKLHQIPAPPAHTLILVNESSCLMTQLLFKLLPLHWDSRVSEFVCEPFQSRASISHDPLALLYISPAGFQSQMLWGSSTQCRSLRLGSPTWGSDLSLLRADLCGCDSPPTCGSPHWWCGFSLDCTSAPPTRLTVAYSLYPWLQKMCSASLQVILETVIPYVVVVFVCLWEEVSSGSSCSTIWIQTLYNLPILKPANQQT